MNEQCPIKKEQSNMAISNPSRQYSYAFRVPLNSFRNLHITLTESNPANR